MKKFLLKEMTLSSDVQNTGRTVRFHPDVTVIRGDNDRGKSSLIKSIMSCLGARPPMVQDKWLLAKVKGLLNFAIDGKEYWSLMNGEAFALFDSKRRILNSSLKVTRGYGPALAQALDFKLKLRSKNAETLVPPPAYYLLPYYIDQDKGWHDTWSSFSNLQHFKDFKKPLVEYHTGVRPNEYYEQRAKLAELDTQKTEPLTKKQLLEHMSMEFTRRHSQELFDIDLNQFKSQVESLLAKANDLKTKQAAVKDSLVEHHSERSVLTHQLAIVEHAQKELHADYVFVTHSLDDAGVSCPTCGQVYANSFAEHFGIAEDEERSVELAIELKDKLRLNQDKIHKTQAELDKLDIEAREIADILESRQGSLQLADLLRSEGTKQVRSFLRVDIDELDKQLDGYNSSIDATKARIAQLTDSDHRTSIIDEYEKLFRKHLQDLDVGNLNERVFRSLAPVITESGSDLPRAILAYVFSIQHLIARHGSAARGPLIIDSPKQQEQDAINERRILEFIRDCRPEGTQLILGSVNTSGVEFNGGHIVLNDKYTALVSDQYEESRARIQPFIERSFELDDL